MKKTTLYNMKRKIFINLTVKKMVIKGFKNGENKKILKNITMEKNHRGYWFLNVL